MAQPRHSWSPTDDLVALYLYLHDDTHLPRKLPDIANRLGMGERSLQARKGNFKFLHLGTGGLDHPSQQSRDIYDQYHSTPELTLRQLVIQAIR